MKLINNRYRIVTRINQDKLMSVYKVEDLWDENKVVQLVILNDKSVSKELIEYYKQDFIHFTSTNNYYIIKDFHFNRLTHINNRKNTETQYYFVSEYNEGYRNITEQLGKLRLEDIIELFITVCRVIHDLHVKGISYGNVCVRNVFYRPEDHKLKLSSLANVRLQNQYNIIGAHAIQYRNLSTEKSNFHLARTKDIHDLGLFFLKLVKQTSNLVYPEKIVKQLETYVSESDKKIALKIKPIIQELIKQPEMIKFNDISEIITAINDVLQTKYEIIIPDQERMLTFKTKLINQDYIIDEIETSVRQVETYEETENIFLLTGQTGYGKTKVLEELEFKYKVQGLDVYSAYTLHTSNVNNRNFWVTLIRKLMRDCDVKVYEKYEKDLKTFFPELDDSFQEGKKPSIHENPSFQLAERIGNFIRDSVHNRQVIFLIDNIHLASEFSLKLLTRLVTVLKHEKAVLVFTYNEEAINNRTAFEKMISEMNELTYTRAISLKTLNKTETEQLMKRILSAPYVPERLVEQTYTLSSGNPAFIIEILQSLRYKQLIYSNKIDGNWHFDIVEKKDLKTVFDAKNIDEIVINQVNRIDENTQELLKKISVILAPKSIEFWERFLELPKDEVQKLFKQLVMNNIIEETVDETITLYGFKSEILHKHLQKGLTKDERLHFHKHAAETIETSHSTTLLDELIYHYEQAQLHEQVKKYSLMNAREMERINDWPSMFRLLKKALKYENNVNRQIEITMQIAERYLARDEKDDAYVYYTKAKKLISTDDMNENVIDIYLRIAKLEIYQGNKEKVHYYFNKLEELFRKFTYTVGEFEFRRIKILNKKYDGKLEETIELCIKLIDDLKQYGDIYIEEIAKIKYLLADAYIHTGRETEESIRLYEETIDIFEQRGLIREQIYSLNNLAGIYLERLHLYNTALKMFTELSQFSKAYNFPSGHVLSLINVGSIYGSKGQITKSYETFKQALTEVKYAKGVKNQLPFIYMNIIRMGLNLHLYKEASHYMELFQEEFKRNSYPEHEEVQMNLATSFVYYAVGVYDKSDEANNKVLASHLDETHPLKGYQYARKLMYQIRTREPADYEEVIQELYDLLELFSSPHYCITILLDFALVLHEEGDLTNVKRLNKEIDKLIVDIEEPNDRIYTRYHYLRGVVTENDEWEEQLLLSLKYAVEEIEFTTRIMVQLAERYFHRSDYYLATNYYLESGFILKRLLEQVKDEHKVSYVHAHQCALVFKRLKVLEQKIIHGKRVKIADAKKLNEVHSVEEVNKLMDSFNVNVFTETKHFMEMMQHEYKELVALPYSSLNKVIANLGNDISKNIEMILSHIIIKTIANRAIVFTHTNNEHYEIIATHNATEVKVNYQIFNRVKATLQPVILHSETDENDLVVNKVKCSMYVPIFGNDYYSQLNQDRNNELFRPDIRHKIIGFLYLESDKVVNNLMLETMRSEIGLLNLIAALIEKQQLKITASIDKVTGALTRKYLEDRINEQINNKKYNNSYFSLMMFDLDRFKRINDIYGHQVGDEVLRKICYLVMEHLDEKGILGRYGGEEFIVILPKTNLEKALVIAEEIRILISEAKLLADDTTITISLGVVSSDQASTLNDLVQKADQALYAAKESGRNRALAWDSKYTKMAQRKKRTQFTTGDEVQDSRNLLALVELLQLANKDVTIDEKVSAFLSRTMEAVDAQNGYLMKIQDNEVKKEWRKTNAQGEIEQVLTYDEQLLKTTIENKEATYIIQLGDLDIANIHSTLPNWQTNLVVPIMFEEDLIGIIYLIASARVKEFEEKDLHIVTVFSNIATSFLMNMSEKESDVT